MRTDQCPECKGEKAVPCPECWGAGKYLAGSEWTHNGVHRDTLHYERCELCSAEGEVECPTCLYDEDEDEDAA